MRPKPGTLKPKLFTVYVQGPAAQALCCEGIVPTVSKHSSALVMHWSGEFPKRPGASSELKTTYLLSALGFIWFWI